MNSLKVLIFSLFLFLLAQPTFADLRLERPDQLLAKASTNRQSLREAVLSLQQQMPEMRDPETFESYFFLLPKLQELSLKFKLDDMYPNAVPSLGKKMAAFGVKWMDLGLMPTSKANYYYQWSDKDVFGSLLGVTNYLLLSYKPTEIEKYTLLTTNVELILSQYFSSLQGSVDLIVGYREMINSIAVTMLRNLTLTPSEQAAWLAKIYTSSGLSAYLDILQKQIYDPEFLNQADFSKLYANLKLAADKFETLLDIKPSWLKDRFADLLIEMIRRSFHANLEIPQNSVESLIKEMSPRALQTLASMLTSLPDTQLLSQSKDFENLSNMILPLLTKNGLITDLNSLQQFTGRVLAAVKIQQQGLEGQYSLQDSRGEKWTFTLVSTRPTEVAAAVADERWFVFKTYFCVRYDSTTQFFTASYSQFEGDTANNGKSVIRFKFDQGRLKIVDAFALPGFTDLEGTKVESFPAFQYADRSLQSKTMTYQGKVKFGKATLPTEVELVLQVSGGYVNARLRDNSGPLFDFVTGHMNQDGTLLMTSTQLGTTWVQFRGQVLGAQLKGYLIVGGRGINTELFKLNER